MVDAHALGACGRGRAGSNPASPTMRGSCDIKKNYLVHCVSSVYVEKGLRVERFDCLRFSRNSFCDLSSN